MTSKSISLVLIGIVFFAFVGCRYLPLVKYHFPKKDSGFPKFSDKEVYAGTNHELRGYDITVYDWDVKVFPESRKLDGLMKISFIMEGDRDTILLDLQKKLSVADIRSDLPIRTWDHRGDLLYVIFDEAIQSGSSGSISIAYEGVPASMMKEGPIQWKKDKSGKPWISTQTEGVGAHFMMPCKELLNDEPEQTFIRVSVPVDLVVVANGRLDSITDSGSFRTFHHSVLNPINIYNISFNIGDFVKIEKPYTDIGGKDRTIEVWALRQDVRKAEVFYDQTPMHMKALEELFGPFPFWRDGCKIVQSTLATSAMEHQSAISMGSILTNDYEPPKYDFGVNTTLIHELAHEWWGNMVSGYDYCDMWIHEGFASYAETLVIEKIYEPEYYNVYIRWLEPQIGNKRPMLKPCGVRYNSWINKYDGDIYTKGPMLLHTLRRHLDDDLFFFQLLREALEEFAFSNVTTDELVAFLSKKSARDLKPLFDTYLRYAEAPMLEYSYNEATSRLAYRWARPPQAPLELKVRLESGGKMVELIPSTESKFLKLSQAPTFDISDFGYVLIKKMQL